MQRFFRRSLSSARYTLPGFQGEPMQAYAPGSRERAALEAALRRTRAEVVEVPCVVGGRKVFTGIVDEQVMPTNHTHVLARFHKATPELVAEAITESQAARKTWASTPFEERAAIFRKAADLISIKHRYDINAATMLGTGKNVWQAEIDSAAESIDFLRLNTKFAEQIYDVQPPLNSPQVWNRMKYRELEGFVVAISPFNFCAIGTNLSAAPALMGNTVLWKPSSTSILSNYRTYEVLLEAGLPQGVISFLPSDGKVIGAAIDHPMFAGLHFTGSTATFNTLWSQIGSNLPKYRSYPRIVGETGGKNFHLVHPSADLDHAVFNTVRSAFEYQGQKCSACSRLYVPKSLWTQFKDKLVGAVESIKVGQPDDFSVFMTAVIDKKSFSKVTGYIDRAKASPSCEIIAGGTYDGSAGYFVRPTVIVTTDPHYESMKEEIFGPVLTVFVYEDAEWTNTLALIDSTCPYALTGAIFAKDRVALRDAEEHLRHAAGNLYLNDKSTGAVVGEQPFGGARMSGTNDKAGSHLNLLRWTSAQAIKEQSGLITDFKYPHMA
jgi:1-pyrroline-5-carboxylate dehydrogenase